MLQLYLKNSIEAIRREKALQNMTNDKKIDDDLLSDESSENIDKNSGTGQYYIPLHQIEKEKIYENLLHLGKLCLRSGGLLVCLYPFKKTPEYI